MTIACASAGFELGLDSAAALALFTAAGERLWVPVWEPQPISGDGEAGSVFLTVSGGRCTTWVVAEFDPARGLARYARWVPGVQAGLVEVECQPRGEARCAVTVSYRLTPLAAEAAAEIAEFLQPARFAGFIAQWKQLIVAAGLARE